MIELMKMDRNNKAYQKVLKHRKDCKKWGKEFCLDCFGEGLNTFVDDFGDESRRELGLPSLKEMAEQSVLTALMIKTAGMNNEEALKYLRKLREQIRTKDGGRK